MYITNIHCSMLYRYNNIRMHAIVNMICLLCCAALMHCLYIMLIIFVGHLVLHPVWRWIFEKGIIIIKLTVSSTEGLIATCILHDMLVLWLMLSGIPRCYAQNYASTVVSRQYKFTLYTHRWLYGRWERARRGTLPHPIKKSLEESI